MIRRTDDLRIRDVRPLIPPAILLEEIPISERASNVVADARAAIAAIISGDDRRLVVVAGPCSIHDTAAAFDYARRLKTVADRLADSLVIVMRTYFEKPRTVLSGMTRCSVTLAMAENIPGTTTVSPARAGMFRKILSGTAVTPQSLAAS